MVQQTEDPFGMWLAFPFRRRRIPLHGRIIVAVLAVCLLLLVLDGWRTWQMRGSRRKISRRNASTDWSA